MRIYRNCLLCPRRCGVNRGAGERGFCGETAELRIASASIHRGEEPPITGQGGSGTVFVSGCNLGCVFCQNYQVSGNRISQGNSVALPESSAALGRAVGKEEFARICLALQEKGAGNINIVTGSHAVPALAAGLDAARAGGLAVPALWNSSAYESPETLELLRGRIAGWLPDLKTLDSDLAARFFRAPGYPETAQAAILKMLDISSAAPGPPSPEAPVIIRHLVLPGFLESTKPVLRWFAEYAAGRARLSLMTQYTPVGDGDMPGRYVDQGEYETLLRWLEEFDIEDGFYQELVPGSDWLPDFSRQNPFSSDLSSPVWHWKDGFV
ncbi:MAG: radical SAM protein [Treponema sp.]|nr:radical SAM protein [Treponema sp.]